jgi:Tfp pilus assembly protein PilF
MQNNELESILLLDNVSFAGNQIPEETLIAIDSIIIQNSDKISDEVFGIYKKFQPMKQEAPDSMKLVLFTTIKNYAIEEGEKHNYISQLLLFRFLLVKTKLEAKDYLNFAKNIHKINPNNEKLINIFINLYQENEENKLLTYIELSDFYKTIKDYKNAIKYYEKFLEIDKTKAVIYNITADLYSKAYPYTSLERQIELYKQSYKLQPDNRLVLHGLAFAYEKLADNENADIFYKKLLQNSPTQNDFYNYGGFLIHCGDFQNGHKYFTHRFNIDDVNLKYPLNDSEEKRWDCISDIKGKKLLIHFEQGFGDTIMYSRFVPLMKKFTSKIIFVVQKELFDLINNAKIFDDIKVITDENIPEYDYSMALLDCPYALNISTNEMPYPQGYLTVNDTLVKNYKDKFINNTNKIRIGISTQGASDANYNERNLDISNLKFLTENKKLELYSLQKDNKTAIEGITPLGETFGNFTDSACAIKSMDLIISTDNVILNLAGSLGVKTIGLFNQQTNYRWYKTTGSDTGWYKSVKPLQNKIQNDWSETLRELNNIVSQF